MTEINDLEKDQLGEIINIGAGNAATALSHMVGQKVQMTVPKTFVGKIDDVAQRFGNATDTVLAVFLKIHGDIDGAMMMIYPPQSALDFLNLLTKKENKDLEKISEEDLSALREVGNILLGSSLTALSKFLDINLVGSIPDAALDMIGAIMDTALIELGQESEEILMFNIDLTLGEGHGEGDMYFIFDPKSSKVLLEATNKKMRGK